MKKIISLEEGKYKIILDEETCEISVLRYDEQWREYLGDKLIYAMVSELIKAQHALFICPDCGYKVQYEEYVS